MLDAEYYKMVRNKRARRLQKDTGIKYTTALREVEKQMEAEKETDGKYATVIQARNKENN